MSSKKELPKAHGCKCPNCGRIIGYGKEGTLLSSTEKEFIHDPDPHLEWTETHKCKACETIFTIENGT